jgi:hypothetical protein
MQIGVLWRPRSGSRYKHHWTNFLYSRLFSGDEVKELAVAVVKTVASELTYGPEEDDPKIPREIALTSGVVNNFTISCSSIQHIDAILPS